MILQCTVCGQDMETKKTTKKYCSRKCESEARKNRIPNQLDRVCLICDTSFILKNSLANQRQCCYDCMPDGVQLTRGMFISKLKEKFQTRCQKCGYNNYTGALEFHHIDPSQKDFTISNMDFKLKDAVEEIKKCVLLCSNCHKELHANLWDLEELKGGTVNGVNL